MVRMLVRRPARGLPRVQQIRGQLYERLCTLNGYRPICFLTAANHSSSKIQRSAWNTSTTFKNILGALYGPMFGLRGYQVNLLGESVGSMHTGGLQVQLPF